MTKADEGRDIDIAPDSFERSSAEEVNALRRAIALYEEANAISPDSAWGLPNALKKLAAAEEAVAYLPRITVREVSVGDSTTGRVGVYGDVKNLGNRTLSKVKVTIYTLGREGTPVFEKSYHPVLVIDGKYSDGRDNTPLKPGYSRSFGVRMDDAPREWTRKVRIDVAAVEFAD